jgi:hypothetical protein
MKCPRCETIKRRRAQPEQDFIGVYVPLTVSNAVRHDCERFASYGGNLSIEGSAAMAASIETKPATGATSNVEQVLFDGHPALFPGVSMLIVAIITFVVSAVAIPVIGGLLVAVLWVIVRFIQTRATHYRVTDRRIIIERGVFSKRMEQLDLYRIADYAVDRPYGQQLMGTGNLTLVTMDKRTPEIHIKGIHADVVALYENVRGATERAKRERGVQVTEFEAVNAR